jgi:uncharacterized delta-60 repeat protein
VLAQRNRRIVVAGGDLATSRFCVARLMPGGKIDTTFGPGGKRRIVLGGNEGSAFGAALQPDGKVVVVGDSDFRVAVARLNTNGTLDATFSGDGKAFFSWGPIGRAMAVLVLPNGKLLVAGFSGPEGGDIAGRAPAGERRAGTRRSAPAERRRSTSGHRVRARGRPQANGRILVAGRSSTAGAVVARLRANGALDPDGRIVLAGYSQGTEDVAVARLNADGSLDASFGNGGKATVDFGAATFGNAVALQADGRIVVAGQKTGKDDFAVARLLR